jgi:polyhydroxybutyrate depolymerase
VRLIRTAPLLAVLLVLVTVTGCGSLDRPVERPPSPDRLVTSATASGQRTALVHHPASARPGAPLVLVLHGTFGRGQQAARAYGWDDLADRDGVVTAYPDGIGREWDVGPGCCGQPHDQHVDDVGYLHQLVGELAAADGVDRARVYAVGFANGAMLAYSWACARPGELAGVGAVAGSPLTDCPHPAPITLAAVHGTHDRIVPIGGGPGPDSLAGVVSPPLEQTLLRFRTADGCPAGPTTHADAGLAAPALVELRGWPHGLRGDHRRGRPPVAQGRPVRS